MERPTLSTAFSRNMSDATANEAERLKNEGNDLYAKKRYSEACKLYEQAVALAPNNYIYLNNAAAAKIALKDYDGSIVCSLRAIKLKDNFKSRARLGTALLAKRKRSEAKKEFLISLAMNPENESVRGQLGSIETSEMKEEEAILARYGLPPPRGGEFKPTNGGKISIIVSLGSIFLSIFTILITLLKIYSFLYLWKLLVLCTIAQQLLILDSRGFIHLSTFSFGNWKELKRQQPSLLMLLSFGLLFAPSQYLISSFIGLFSLLEICNHTTDVIPLLGPLNGFLGPRLQLLQQNQLQIRVCIGSFEAFTAIACLLSMNFVLTPAYLFYVLKRYQHDVFVAFAFKMLKERVEKITQASFLPVFIDDTFQMICSYVHRYAQVL